MMRKYVLPNLPLFSFCSVQTGSFCETVKYRNVLVLKSDDISEKPDFSKKSGFLNTGKLLLENLTCLTKHEVKNA